MPMPSAEAPTVVKANIPATSATLKMFFIGSVLSRKPSRVGRTPATIIRCALGEGKFHCPKAAAISAKLRHGRKTMVNQSLTKTSLGGRHLLASAHPDRRGGLMFASHKIAAGLFALAALALA